MNESNWKANEWLWSAIQNYEVSNLLDEMIIQQEHISWSPRKGELGCAKDDDGLFLACMWHNSWKPARHL